MAAITTIEISKENEEILEKAQVGDMIEFSRGTYSHWGIYIGNRRVIHRWGEDDGIGQSVGLWGNITTIFGREFDKAKILETEMLDVLKYGGKIRVNNYLDVKYRPLSPNDILDKARRCLNQEGYNLVYSNCEHFATECRYGQPNSRQVQYVVGSSIAAGIFISLIAAAGAYFLHKSTEKDEKEHNTKEIAIKM